jgi:hypothetical protein
MRDRRSVVKKPFRFGVNVVRAGSRHEWAEKPRLVREAASERFAQLVNALVQRGDRDR